MPWTSGLTATLTAAMIVSVFAGKHPAEPDDPSSPAVSTVTHDLPSPDGAVEADVVPLPTIPDHGALFATTAVDLLRVQTRPDGQAAEVTTLSRWSHHGLPRTLMVVDTHRADDGAVWLQVLLPDRPNGRHGWIRAADVTTGSTTLEIHVQLETRSLHVFDNGQPILDVDVAIGTASTPTPTGTFYVTDPVDLQANPTGVYGAFAIGISGHSEVLDEFDGGPAQIAIHGTNRPELIGQAVSNGCIRLPNATVLELAQLVHPGIPVHIHA